MEYLATIDPFATKAIEYVLVLVFLALAIPFGLAIVRMGPAKAVRGAAARLRTFAAGWFQTPAGVHFHPGHGWAAPETSDTVRVGLDDFAHKLLGDPTGIELPELNSFVEEGQTGWRVQVGSESVAMLSPVRGAVVEVNPKVLESPDLIGRDPYGEGWLMKVRVQDTKAAMRNLLSGRYATAWMEETADALRERMGGAAGLVMQDGGAVVTGFSRELSPDGWQQLASEFLLTE